MTPRRPRLAGERGRRGHDRELPGPAAANKRWCRHWHAIGWELPCLGRVRERRQTQSDTYRPRWRRSEGEDVRLGQRSGM